MKSKGLLYILVLLLIAFFPKRKTVNLEVTVSNINSSYGSIELAVFNTPHLFIKKNKAYRNYTRKVSGDTLVINIVDLPKGDYAISLYHDINSDKVCNLNALGIPKETYGFSNNIKPRFKKPKFKDCKIKLKENTSTEIRLIQQN